MQFIATVHFHNADRDAVAVLVTDATDKTDATNQAIAFFQEEGPSEADILTVDEFESDFGAFDPGMFIQA